MRLQALKNVLNLEAIQRGENADPVVVNKDGTERPLTTEEMALMDTEYARLIEEKETQNQAVASAKQAALAKLMKLGLTEEEALALGK
jgi:hypothetical protein